MKARSNHFKNGKCTYCKRKCNFLRKLFNLAWFDNCDFWELRKGKNI